jgi:phage FluMu protein Com
MKLTVSLDSRTFSIDLPEAECRERFITVIGFLTAEVKQFNIQETPNETTAALDSRKPEKSIPLAIVEKREEIKIPVTIERKTETTPLPVMPEKDSSAKASYRGFLYLKCPSCGEVRGFHAKTEISRYHCRGCGATSEIPNNLVRLYVDCECGSKFKYLTNIEDAMFDIPCLNCESPVPVQFNLKDCSYKTIGKERRK